MPVYMPVEVFLTRGTPVYIVFKVLFMRGTHCVTGTLFADPGCLLTLTDSFDLTQVVIIPVSLSDV